MFLKEEGPFGTCWDSGPGGQKLLLPLELTRSRSSASLKNLLPLKGGWITWSKEAASVSLLHRQVLHQAATPTSMDMVEICKEFVVVHLIYLGEIII